MQDYFFFACGISSPGRVEREHGAAACVSGILVAPSVQEHRLLPLQEVGPIRVFFEPLVAGDQKASLASLSSQLHPFGHLEGSFAWGQAHRGASLTGVVLCRLAHGTLKRAL